MNRRQFALSWGRKTFFGLSLPLSLFLGLIYLRSFIFPTGALEWLYFVTSYFGQLGLLNVLAYFLLFCPVVLLFPTYYVSRFWSLIIILVLNLFLILDALSFSSFHLHLYSYIFRPLLDTGFINLFPAQVLVTLVSVAMFIFALIIWIRGEMVWRKMQGRFSNPVKNWYLVAIILCLAISRFALHSSVSHSLAAVFPLNKESINPIDSHNDSRRMIYPSSQIICSGKSNPNVIMIVLKEWEAKQFSPEAMPLTYHMKRHGITFNKHYNVSSDSAGGLFSLLFSVPASYMSSARKSEPALYTELKNRKYEMVFMNENEDAKTIQKFRDWIIGRSEEISSYYLSVQFSGPGHETDSYIQEIILELQKEGLLKASQIVITGAHSDEALLPLLWVNPDRKVAEVNHPTTPYDVVPTLMQRIWNCKNTFSAASTGKQLDQPEREWILVSGPEEFKIVDLKNNGLLSVKERFIQEEGYPREGLIFPALKMMTEFYRMK